LRASDAEALIALHASMTREDHFRRFFTADPIDLRQLAHDIAGNDARRGAIGAFHGTSLIGIANYVVLGAGPIAEFALVVDHAYQDHGVGTELMERLARLAVAHGINEFVADVLSENSPALEILFDCRWPITARRSDGVMRFDIALVRPEPTTGIETHRPASPESG
jgi:GNAT superfamily N-acetyltransferase